METLITIDNFELPQFANHEINSPRTLEACLRSGYDPAELRTKPKMFFKTKDITEEMLEIKHNTFERKRLEKIETVRAAREAIIVYSEKHKTRASSTDHLNNSGTKYNPHEENDKVSHMLEMEQKRFEAVKRRQEKELSKIVSREQAMVTLQAKIKKSEDEEIRKKKLHEKKVAEQKIQADKKKAQRAKELAEKEYEEQQKRREIARREAEFERKKKIADEAAARQLVLEAREREREREEKMEEHRKHTAMLIQQQIELAERNRAIMAEREARVKAQLDAKVQAKKEEITTKQQLAAVRISEALKKHHELHEAKKQAFNESQRAAKLRAKEIEAAERQALKQQAEERDKKNRIRYNRLVEAARLRSEHRADIQRRRLEKDSVFEKIKKEREEELAMKKFYGELKKSDKLENVERVARLNEFLRLQTLQKAHEEDLRYEKIQFDKMELQRRHREESKNSLTRKHAIANAMDLMRVTNDYTLLDQLFTDKKNRRRKTKKNDDVDGDDPRLNQTV